MNPQQLINDACECVVCMDTMSSPRYLSCGHTFCNQCAGNIQPASYVHRGVIPCPICRKSSRKDQEFPVNHAIAELVNHHNTTTVDQLVDSVGCASCRNAGHVMTAGTCETPRLLQCGHTFCEDCIGRRLITVFYGHPMTGCPTCGHVSPAGVENPVNYQLAELFKLSADRLQKRQATARNRRQGQQQMLVPMNNFSNMMVQPNIIIAAPLNAVQVTYYYAPPPPVPIGYLYRLS